MPISCLALTSTKTQDAPPTLPASTPRKPCSLLFDQTGKVFKTHKGVQSEFLRLTKDDPRWGSDLRVFLSQAYNLKAIADYEEGEDPPLFAERSAAATETASRFVDFIAELLGDST